MRRGRWVAGTATTTGFVDFALSVEDEQCPRYWKFRQ